MFKRIEIRTRSPRYIALLASALALTACEGNFAPTGLGELQSSDASTVSSVVSESPQPVDSSSPPVAPPESPAEESASTGSGDVADKAHDDNTDDPAAVDPSDDDKPNEGDRPAEESNGANSTSDAQGTADDQGTADATTDSPSDPPVRPAPPDAPAKDLAGTSWRLVGGIDLSGAAGTPTAIFNKSGGLGGSDSCNIFKATYSSTGDGQIDVSDRIATSRRACPGGDLQVAATYLDRLAAVESYALDGDQLTLTGPGVTLQFESTQKKS